MRNLKKILALALALVMTLSVMTVANAKSVDQYADQDSIDPAYATAADVVAQLGIFQGVSDTQYGPKATMTRDQLALIIYRITTGDVDGKYLGNYAGGASVFSDVSPNAWYAGAVVYAADSKYLLGYDGKYGPEQPLIGYQVLAGLLRAIGYNKDNDFTGADWTVQVAKTAKETKITDGIVADWNQPITREVTAQLIYNALFTLQVAYTPAFGYQTFGQNNLAYDTFKITSGKAGETTKDNDAWGRPSTVWLKNNSTVVVSIAEKAIKTYYTAVTECQIAADVKLNKVTTYDLYTNGVVNKSEYKVQPTDTVQTLGAQGTVTEVYKDRIVVIDTFLAKVADVKDATYDAAGHLKTNSRITLAVYTDATQNTDTAEYVYQENGKTNYTYSKGDYVLVNAYTSNTVNTTTGDVTVNHIQPTVATGTAASTVVDAAKATYIEINGLASTLVGAQTKLHWNDGKHTVNGTDYNDAKWFKLDQAQQQTAQHTWLFDSFGNLIGVVDIATQYSYGIIENIQWQNPSMANGYAQATIRYMDGTTAVKTVVGISGSGLYTPSGLTYKTTADTTVVGYNSSLGKWVVSTSLAENATAYNGKHLFRIEETSNGLLLSHVTYSVTSGNTTTTCTGQLNNATIKNGLAYITGTAQTSGGSSYIYTNSNTVYLVQTSTGYERVVGYENIASYTGTATVDYIDVNGDSYAEYVYVTGTPDNAQYQGVFYLTSNTTSAPLRTSGGIAYYEVQGIADGVAGTYKVSASVINSLIPSVSGTNTSYVNRMFVVHYTGGIIDGVVGPYTNSTVGASLSTVSGAYKNATLIYSPSGTAATWNGQVLALTGAPYAQINVVGLNPVVGEFAANLTNKEVYVLFDGLTQKAVAVYIADPAENGNNSGVAPSTNDTLFLSNVSTNYTAQLVAGTTTGVNNTTAVTLQRRAVGSTEWETVASMNYSTGSGTVATPWTYAGTFTNGGNSIAYEMRAVATTGTTVVATSNIVTVYA